jgi:hypothetical protein
MVEVLGEVIAERPTIRPVTKKVIERVNGSGVGRDHAQLPYTVREVGAHVGNLTG